MENFTITDNITIACEWKKTRNGFKHEAALLIDGSERERVKINYLNRTWEAYTYQSVIHKLIEKSRILTKEQRYEIVKYMDGADGYSGAGCNRDMRGLRSVGLIAALGGILNTEKKSANDWKARMLQAGLGGHGLVMPEDWDTLDEDTKEARLDAVIKELAKK